MILSSPYIRAKQTAEAICEAGGLAGGAKPTILDERLREREFGVFDGLTTVGIRAALSRRGRAPRQDGQILPPRAGRRELGRRHPAAAFGAQHDQPPLCRQARAGRLPPGRRAVHALHPRGTDRGARSSPSTSRPRSSTAASPPTTSAATQMALCVPTLALWNHGAPMEEEGTPKTAEPDMMTGSR